MVYLTCAIIGLGGRGVIKTWTEVDARVRLYMLTSDLTSLVPPQFSHWLQVRKVGTAYSLLLLLLLLLLSMNKVLTFKKLNLKNYYYYCYYYYYYYYYYYLYIFIALIRQ